MKMFTPSGDQVLVEKSQVPALENSGWTKEAPEVKEVKESEEAVAAPTEEEVAPRKILRKKKA